MSANEKYHQMALSGAKPEDVYFEAKADSLKFLQIIKVLREVFGLSIAEAKEVTIVSEGQASSLSEYQEKLLPGLTEALKKPPGKG